MTDREMLELAARAAGVENFGTSVEDGISICSDPVVYAPWNPLTDDGDALRLAVQLGISLTPYPIYNSDARHSVIAKQRRRSDTLREANPTECMELYGSDPYAATRRAIVRAAAEIGQQKEE